MALTYAKYGLSCHGHYVVRALLLVSSIVMTSDFKGTFPCGSSNLINCGQRTD